MNRTLGQLLLAFLGITGLQANFSPAAWHSVALPTASPNNQWFIVPDETLNPNIFVKGTAGSGSVNRRLLTGGPPEWTASATSTFAINGKGAFVPLPTGGGYLVAPHNSTLKLIVFDSAGNPTIESTNVDGGTGTYTQISVGLDPTNKLHVGFVRSNTTIGYARRSGVNSWERATQGLGTDVIDATAVIPLSFTNVSLYYTRVQSNVRVLWRATPKKLADNNLYITSGSHPLADLATYVEATLSGSIVGSAERLYFFDRPSPSTVGGLPGNARTLMRYSGTGSPSEVFEAGNAVPKSIHVAKGPDGALRLAWFDVTNKKIRFLKPVTAGLDALTLGGDPVTLTGALSDPDLLGLHFGPDDTPYLLYRRNLNEGFVAFPNDNFDFNGNGRPEILDTAFNSNHAGPEALPVKAGVSGIFNSENRFKIRFPTIGNAIPNGTGGVQSTTENLLYKVEVSPDLENWTPLNVITAIGYTATPTSGDLKSFVGVINTPAPGAFPSRFARLNVTRLKYPY